MSGFGIVKCTWCGKKHGVFCESFKDWLDEHQGRTATAHELWLAARTSASFAEWVSQIPNGWTYDPDRRGT